jgi:hypothetical protein
MHFCYTNFFVKSYFTPLLFTFFCRNFFYYPFLFGMGGVSIFDFFSDRLCWAQCMARRDSYFVKRGGTGWVGFVLWVPSPPSSTASAWFFTSCASLNCADLVHYVHTMPTSRTMLVRKYIIHITLCKSLILNVFGLFGRGAHLVHVVSP